MPSTPSKSALRGLRAILAIVEQTPYTDDADQWAAVTWLRAAIEEGETVRRVDDRLGALLNAERLEIKVVLAGDIIDSNRERLRSEGRTAQVTEAIAADTLERSKKED